MENEYFNYITASEEDLQWGIHLNVAGFASIQPQTIYPPTQHPSGYYFTWKNGRILNEYQVNFITEGAGVFETKDGVYNINAGSVIFLYPGMWHRYRPLKNSGWKEHYIGFNGQFADHLFNNNQFFSKKQPVVHVGFQERILRPFYSIIDEVKEEKPGYQQVCSGLLIQMLGTILSAVKNKEFEGKDIEKKIRRAKVYFRDNINKTVNVEELASELNIGYSYFRKTFKRFTGISPVQYHLQLRVQKAKELLVCTDKSVKEIALELGFQSIFYFTRIYKKKMGVNPTDERKKLPQENTINKLKQSRLL